MVLLKNCDKKKRTSPSLADRFEIKCAANFVQRRCRRCCIESVLNTHSTLGTANQVLSAAFADNKINFAPRKTTVNLFISIC